MPIITRLKTAGRKGSRTVVELDGEPWAEVDAEVVLLRALRKGDCLTPEQAEELLADDAFVRARRAAAVLLRTRPRSEAELGRRLLERDFDPATVERTLRHFAGMGDLDDERFARLYARNQFKTRRIGPVKVRHQLRRLGVAEAVIDAALADDPAAQTGRQLEQAVAFLQRRLKNADRGVPRQQRRKMRAALVRAGFESDVCAAALDQFRREEVAPEKEENF